MKTLVSMILSVCLIGTALAQRPNEMPKPGPEMQKLAANWCGEYTYSGKNQTTPLGPGGEITGRVIVRPILNGFATEAFYYGKGPEGETQSREICWYDAVTKKYFYTFVSNDGYFEQAPFTLIEGIASWEGTCVSDGRRYKIRGSDTNLSDGTGFIRKDEVSIDGKTWLPLQESKYVKIKAAANKDEVAQELLQLQQQANRAAIEGDIEFLDQYYADEFIGVYMIEGKAADSVFTKKRTLDDFKSGAFKLLSIDDEGLEIRVSDDSKSAAMIGWIHIRFKQQGKVVSEKHWATITLVKKPCGWQCVGENGLIVPSKIAETTNDVPEPSPEMKKLEGFVGDWTYEGEQADPPVAGLPYGPAGKYYGTSTTRFILNRAFLETQIEDNNPSGKTSITRITGYDSNAKNYVEQMYVSDGSRSVATATLNGRTWTVSSTMTTINGKKVPVRTIAKYSPDWSSWTSKVEVSPDDGKTWKFWFKDEGRKLKK